MELIMNTALDAVQKSGIRLFTQMARQKPGCLFLTLGEPDFDTPLPVCAAAKAGLDAGETHYGETTAKPFSAGQFPILSGKSTACPMRRRRSLSPWAPPKPCSAPFSAF